MCVRVSPKLRSRCSRRTGTASSDWKMPTTEGQVVNSVISDKLVCEKSLFMQDVLLIFSKGLCVCS